MHKTFLRWLLFVSLSTVGLGLAYTQGIVEEIWSTDTYYISTIIFALYVYATVSCGYLAFKVGNQNTNYVKTIRKSNLENIAITLERNWFIASVLISLGFVGTILGMILITYDIGNMDLDNVNLTNFSSSMSLALNTTIMGLITNLLLRIQCFTIQQNINKIVKEDL